MKQIELLLLETIDNLGLVGDVVKVRPGYARNFLLPRGLAEPPSDDKIAALAEKREQARAEQARIQAEHESLIEKVHNYEITIERAANDQGVLFGGVSQHEIAEALKCSEGTVKSRLFRGRQLLKEKLTPYWNGL